MYSTGVLVFLACCIVGSVAWELPPFCKDKKIDRHHYSANNLGTTRKHEKALDKRNPDIDDHISAALACGKTCFEGGPNCGNIPGTRKRRSELETIDGSLQNRETHLSISKRAVRSCDPVEEACHLIVKGQENAKQPKYAKPTKHSVPQCEKNIRALKWVKRGGKWCKVVNGKDADTPAVRATSCNYMGCCVGDRYSTRKKCKPDGWTKKVFCVYCPKAPASTADPRPDPYGKMRILVRWYPQCCSCQKQWCGYYIN